MANVLKHRFTSGKTDGADATQVQPSHWNDGHNFGGGNHGDILTRDGNDAAYGATWVAPTNASSLTSGGFPGLDPGSLDYVILLDSASPQDLHGVIPSSGNFKTGARLQLANLGAGTFTLIAVSSLAPTGRFYNSSAATSATRVKGLSGGAAGGSAAYVWSGTIWCMVDHEQGGVVPLSLTDSNFVGFTGTVYLQEFYLHGRDVHIRFQATANVPTSVSTIGISGWPWTFGPPGHNISALIRYDSGSIYTVFYAQIRGNGSGIDLLRADGQPWTVGSHTLYLDITVPIL